MPAPDGRLLLLGLALAVQAVGRHCSCHVAVGHRDVLVDLTIELWQTVPPAFDGYHRKAAAAKVRYQVLQRERRVTARHSLPPAAALCGAGDGEQLFVGR